MKKSESVGRWISALYRYTRIYIDKEFERFQIGSGQHHVLMVLYKNDGINQEAISKVLNLDKATIARAVNKLINHGYVQRTTDPKDHRAYILHVTHKGKKIEPEIKKTLSHISSILLTGFNQREKETALRLLKKMYQNMISIDLT